MDTNRPLTKLERIEGRHLLQELSEHALLTRNALDPQHGMHTVTFSAWQAQLTELTRALEFFTDKCWNDRTELDRD